MLWEIDIYPADGQPDRDAARIAAEAADLGIAEDARINTAQGYLIQGRLDREQITRLVAELLADQVVERTVIGVVGDEVLARPPVDGQLAVHVLPQPGVMDPVAQSAQSAIADLGFDVQQVCTFRKVWINNLSSEQIDQCCAKILANDAIEQVIVGPLKMDRIDLGTAYLFQLVTVPLLAMDERALETLSSQGQLYLSLVEMRTIQDHFRQLDRDPTDVELETIAPNLERAL